MPPAVQNLVSAPLPLAVVAMLLVQTAGVAYFGGSRITAIESKIQQIDQAVGAMSSHEKRLIVTEEGVLRIREDLAEIKTLLRERASNEDPTLKIK